MAPGRKKLAPVFRTIPLCFFALFAFVASAPGREQEFRLDRPEAKSVGLAGEFNGWKSQPMARRDDGIWTLTVPLPPGLYGYKFLVNGSEWLIDPGTTLRKQVNGIENSAIEIAEEGSGDGSGTTVPAAPDNAPSPAPAPSGATSADIPFTPGEVTTFDVPLSSKQRSATAKGGNAAVSTARIALGVPQNFDPHKSWPLLIISATVNASNIELLGAYRQAALDAGWVIMAADPPVKPKEDETERRLALIEGGLDYLGAHWPNSKNWPVAAGGFSGGAKRSGYVAAALLKSGRKLIGCLMAGCNGDTASDAARRMTPPYAFKLVPIFLSSGTKDTIATPEMIQWVERSIKSNGFRKVRFESFEGAHDVYPPHTTEALRWFLETAAQTGPTPKSGFDSFFKKQ